MRRPFATADGYLCVLPYTTPQWHRFFGMIGRDDLAADADLANPVLRNARLEELYGLIATAMPRRTTKAWVVDLLAADILFGEMNSVEDLLHDKHLAAFKLFTEHDHPTEGRIRVMRHPVQGVGDNMTDLDRLPPRRGQHSREVLVELGFQSAEIDALLRAGDIVTAALIGEIRSPTS